MRSSRPAPPRWPALLPLITILACGSPAPEPSREAAAPAQDCATATSDSARAVCIALDTIQALSGQPSRVLGITREGDRSCIRTIPTGPRETDGGGAVLVGPDARVLSVVLADSAACAPPA